MCNFLNCAIEVRDVDRGGGSRHQVETGFVVSSIASEGKPWSFHFTPFRFLVFCRQCQWKRVGLVSAWEICPTRYEGLSNKAMTLTRDVRSLCTFRMRYALRNGDDVAYECISIHIHWFSFVSAHEGLGNRREEYQDEAIFYVVSSVIHSGVGVEAMQLPYLKFLMWCQHRKLSKNQSALKTTATHLHTDWYSSPSESCTKTTFWFEKRTK